MQRWMVVRTGDSGTTHLVRDGLDEDAAAGLVAELQARGHKQHYRALPYGAGERSAVIERHDIRE